MAELSQPLPPPPSLSRQIDAEGAAAEPPVAALLCTVKLFHICTRSAAQFGGGWHTLLHVFSSLRPYL